MSFTEVLNKIKLKNEQGVSLINPKDNDYIICEYEPHSLTQYEQKSLYDGLNSIFNNNKIVIIPSNVNLFNCTRNEIKNVISNLQYMLDNEVITQ